jgi:hypothetical protein
MPDATINFDDADTYEANILTLRTLLTTGGRRANKNNPVEIQLDMYGTQLTVFMQMSNLYITAFLNGAGTNYYYYSEEADTSVKSINPPGGAKVNASSMSTNYAKCAAVWTTKLTPQSISDAIGTFAGIGAKFDYDGNTALLWSRIAISVAEATRFANVLAAIKGTLSDYGKLDLGPYKNTINNWQGAAATDANVAVRYA